MNSVELFLRLFTSIVLIVAAILARDAPTAFVILAGLGIANLVFTVGSHRRRSAGQG